jgi:hypothetical protein
LGGSTGELIGGVGKVPADFQAEDAARRTEGRQLRDGRSDPQDRQGDPQNTLPQSTSGGTLSVCL